MTLSIKAGLARPVRIVDSSAAKCSTDLVILDSASRSTGSIIPERCDLLSRAHKRADFLAEHDTFDVARLQQIEDDDRHVVVHAERKRRVVHHLDATIENLEISESFEFDRVGITLRVCRVNAVNLGRLEDYVRFDLHSAKRGGFFGGDIWVAVALRAG